MNQETALEQAREWAAKYWAEKARADIAEAALAWIRKLPVVRDDDGDCWFCLGPSADPIDESGHNPDCVYSNSFAELGAITP